METSTALKKAMKLHAQIEGLLKPHDEKLRVLLDDDSAHFCFQPGDSWCIAYRGGLDNAAVAFLSPGIDKVMEMDKTEALEVIDRAGI